MKKRRTGFLLVGLTFCLTAFFVYLFITKKPELKSYFLLPKIPSIAGVSTNIPEKIKLLDNLAHPIKTSFPQLATYSGILTERTNLLENISDQINKRAEEMRNSLIQAALEKIGYKSTTPSSCP